MIWSPIFAKTERGVECVALRSIKGKVFTIYEFLTQENEELEVIADYTIVAPTLIYHILLLGIKADIRPYYIKFEGRRRAWYVCSYENKYLSNFSTHEAAEALIKADLWGQPTGAQDACDQARAYLSRWHNIWAGKVIYPMIYPAPSPDKAQIMELIKPLLAGQHYIKSAGLYREVYSYDRKRAFPAACIYGKLPSGEALTLPKTGKPLTGYWYIKQIFIYTLQAKTYDFLGLVPLIKEHGALSLWITTEIEEIINLHYKAVYVTLNGFMWKYRECPFTDMFLANMTPNTAFKAVSTYNKARNNMFIGTFGKNIRRNSRTYYLDGDSLRTKVKSDTLPPEALPFLPFWLCVNGRAKLEICNVIAENIESIVYANTDGIFSTKPIDFRARNTQFTHAGYWEYRGLYSELCIKEISHYAGMLISPDGEATFDMRLSGRAHSCNNLQDFIEGNYLSTIWTVTYYGFPNPIEHCEFPLEVYSPSNRRGGGKLKRK